MKVFKMIQRVGDRDKVAYSIKPYAFTILSNAQSKCQYVIEISYEDSESDRAGQHSFNRQLE